jgi:MoaA/NifB/PqqE/SkfB family radical SAM enzyme
MPLWEKRFNGLYKSGIRSVLLVGGEPALRIDVLMLADRIFPFVFVITNGTVKIPKEFNHRLYVSIDGNREINDSVRGEGVFSRVIENYSGDKRVVINMTLTRDNYRELEAVTKIAKENGFNGVVCNICAGATDVTSPMVVKKEERKNIIKELKHVKTLYPRDLLLTKTMIKWYEYPDHRGSCYWGDDVSHFDVSWNRRRCFGNKSDCANCGCLAGAFQSPMRMLRHPRETIKIGLCS